MQSFTLFYFQPVSFPFINHAKFIIIPLFDLLSVYSLRQLLFNHDLIECVALFLFSLATSNYKSSEAFQVKSFDVAARSSGPHRWIHRPITLSYPLHIYRQLKRFDGGIHHTVCACHRDDLLYKEGGH